MRHRPADFDPMQSPVAGLCVAIHNSMVAAFVYRYTGVFAETPKLDSIGLQTGPKTPGRPQGSVAQVTPRAGPVDPLMTKVGGKIDTRDSIWGWFMRLITCSTAAAAMSCMGWWTVDKAGLT
jgi:hypothetical protein